MSLFNLRVKGKYIFSTVALSLTAILSCTSVYILLLQNHSINLYDQLTSQTKTSFEKTVVSQANQLSEYLATAMFDPLYHYNPDQASHLMEAIMKIDSVEKVIVFDTNGYIFHDGSRLLLNFGKKFYNSEVLSIVLDSGSSYQAFKKVTFHCARPIRVNDKIIGGVYIEYSLEGHNKAISDMSGLLKGIKSDAFKKLFLTIGIVTLIISALSILLAILIARSISNPITRLTQYVKLVGNSSFAYPQRLLSTTRKDEIGELANAFSEMSLELENKTERITFQAYQDSLTALPNRLHFMEHVTYWLKTDSNPCSILFIDLDDFKAINDNYGHEKGNEFLCQMSERLRNVISKKSFSAAPNLNNNEPLMARVGGDEFLVYLPGIGSEHDVINVINNLFSAIHYPVMLGNNQAFIHASIGVAIYPHTTDTAEELIKYADIAMYNAKAEGKNTYKFFTQTMNDDVTRKAQIEMELHKALNDLKQFELWYQPQVDLKTENIVGAEALVRWRHPELGIIPPDEFIPIAEATGLIVPVGNWLTELACIQLNEWRDSTDPDFYISFNLSAKQIYRNDIVQHILSCMQKHKIEPHSLHIEITETLLLKDEMTARQTIERLREAGLKVWLDDFGTGYSSLAYLSRFELDGIKIDRCFVRDLPDNSKDKKLVETLMALAKRLQIDVISEGIEDRAQADYLRGKECQYGQGYYYSKPVEPDMFFEKLHFRSNIATT